jgi:glycosyltransferase involved in cell wall biosynthesis
VKSLITNGIPLLTPLTGVGRYTYEVAKRIDGSEKYSDYYYYGYFAKKLMGPGEAELLKGLKRVVSSVPLLKSLARRAMKIPARIYAGKRYDLYWEPNFIPEENIESLKTVVTVHDFSFHGHPEWHPAERIGYFEENFMKKISRADTIVTVSEKIKSEAMEILGIPSEKIEVIYNGIDHDLFRIYDEESLREFRERVSIPEKFILFVGSIEPRKNLLNLLKAYHRLDEESKREFPLIIAGFKGWENREIMDEMEKEKEHIAYLGYLDDRDLAMLYSSASIFVYPSLYEGFGIPPVEAMASGTPVLTSSGTVMEEICADAVIYADPFDIDDISSKLHLMISDDTLRDDLVRRGVERASLYDWERCAREHMRLFDRILAG